jgi:hypothetical protein
MKELEKERIIPAQTIIEKVFVAEDGKEFRYASDCELYELDLLASKIPHEVAGGLDWYFLKDKEDFILLSKSKLLDSVYHFDKEGFLPNEWYVFKDDNNGYGRYFPLSEEIKKINEILDLGKKKF